MDFVVKVCLEVSTTVIEDYDTSAERFEVFEGIFGSIYMSSDACKVKVGGLEVHQFRIEFYSISVSFAPFVHVWSDDECFLSGLCKHTMKECGFACARCSKDDGAFCLSVWKVVVIH